MPAFVTRYDALTTVKSEPGLLSLSMLPTFRRSAKNETMSDNPLSAGHYLGVPKEVLTAIGKMMVIAGRVEDVASQLAAAFNIDSSKLQFKRVRLEIAEALTRPTPPWIHIHLSAIEVLDRSSGNCDGSQEHANPCRCITRISRGSLASSLR